MARGSITRTVSPTTGKVSWRARFSYADDAGERQHRSKSFPTRKTAEAWLTRAQHELRLSSCTSSRLARTRTFASLPPMASTIR